MTELEKINKLNEKRTKLEKHIKTLLHQIESTMCFMDDSTFNQQNSIMFTISSIESELKKLDENHLNEK